MFPPEKLPMPQASKIGSMKVNTMGDRSPKSVSKHAAQKQTKSNRAAKAKVQAVTAKQAAGKKK
jgi:hypothetical protein